jgi:hypothetical protein
VELKFSGQLNEREYRAIVGVTARRVWIVSGTSIALLVAANLSLTGPVPLSEDLAGAALSWLPAALVVPVLVIAHSSTVRRQWRNNRLIQMPISGMVAEDGILWNVEGVSSARLPWALLSRYREGAGGLLVYHGTSQVFYFFPRFFAGESDWQEFRRMVGMKLPRG